MNKKFIKYGFITAGLVNILGVLSFSKAFSNTVLNNTDPIVMSNFGLLMIIVWGLAYISVANSYEKVKWLVMVFALEKLVYVIAWGVWMLNNNLKNLFNQDLFAGLFYTVYGPNDFIFMLFFLYVFYKIKN